MAKKKKKYSRCVAVMLEDKDYEEFEAFCHKTGLSQSAVFRTLYKQHFKQFVENMKRRELL